MSGKVHLSPQISIHSVDIYWLRILTPPISFVFPGNKKEWRAAQRAFRLAKRLMDLAGAAALLALLSPVIAAILGLVALDGGSPLYAHERVGRHGRPFRCWKVRTMVLDAGARLEDLLRIDPIARSEWARNCKLPEDPRATWIGRFLRRTSLDELPQLWNVLRGEMSLVGPRPITREELPRYGSVAPLYCSVRPGLTGIWQVFGRVGTTYEQRVAMDRHYIENPSILRDFVLVLMTLSVIVHPTGR
jgi:lipopolysaccharide/colanic/teichoic acid biosynthesis glycosyltransferase